MRNRSTERLMTAVVLSAAGIVFSLFAGRSAFAVMVAPWFVLMAIGLAGHRRQPARLAVTVDSDRVFTDDEIELNVTVTGPRGRVKLTPRPRGRFAWSARKSGGRDGGTDKSMLGVAEVAGGGRPTTLDVTLRADRWGTFDVGRFEIEVTEPFGLFRQSAILTDPTAVRVHPSPRQVAEMAPPRLVRRTTGSHPSRSADRGVEYADLRPYSAGDSLRDINWRISARSDRLWASQRHPDRSTDVILLLDSFVESGHDVHAVVGLAIEAAVALAESHLAVTDRVGFVELGGSVRWVAPGTGRLQLQRLVDALLGTGLFANAADRDLAIIAPQALPPRSFILALSPLLDGRFRDALLELAGRGHDLAVIECDPAVTPPADDGPEQDAENPSRRAAQLAWRLWQAERRLLRDQLVQRGVAVAPWDRDVSLDATITELVRRRRRLRSVRRA